MGGFKLVVVSTWLLTISAFTVEKNAIGGGCIDLLCPETASHHGLRNLVNEETLKTDACTSCNQCTENGYSVCLRPKDSRASRTAGGCSCSHTLAANCQTDLTQTSHPGNLTMMTYTACYSDALQRPPQPLAVNENSSVVVTIEPFWLEPYWRHVKIENVTLHYKFNVKAPEHCEGQVESTHDGVHTCTDSVLVDLSESQEDHPQGKEDEDYDHSDNYDQYDDDLPPEVQFDRDVFSGAKQLESYYTATVRRTRQIKSSAPKNEQIFDGEKIIESEHLKFDLKPEVYGLGDSDLVPPPTDFPTPVVTGDKDEEIDEESATVIQEDNNGGDVSEETGGTNFFEEEEKKEEAEKKKDEESDEKEEDGVLKVNLEDIEPTKLKSQEEAKKNTEGNDEETEETVEEKDEVEETETTTSSDVEKEEETEEKKKSSEDEEEITEESTTVSNENEEAGEEKDASSEEDDETTTVELVEGEQEMNFWQRFINSHDFPRVRNITIGTLIFIIGFCLLMLCIFYRRYICCQKKKESKTSNGYRYTSANQPPTELKTVSRAHSCMVPEEESLLAEGEAMENFRNVVKSGTPLNPNKVEMGITVGMGKFGPIYRAMFNSYNGSVHDVNIYMLKNINRLSDEQLVKLTSLLKANILAGAHQNVVSLCGISPAGSDIMLMWEPLHQSVLRGVLRESRCARFGTEPFNMASFLSSERLAAIAIGCCNGVEHLLKKNVFPSHLSTSNVLLAERGIVKIGGFGLAEHHALDMTTESAPTKMRWMPPEYFKQRNQKMMYNEQTVIWPLGVTLWEIFSLGGTPFASLRQVQTFIDAMRDGSAYLDPITYCGEAVTQLISTCTSHFPDARGDLQTIIKRLECISADAKTQINLSYREDFPYLPIVTQLEHQVE